MDLYGILVVGVSYVGLRAIGVEGMLQRVLSQVLPEQASMIVSGGVLASASVAIADSIQKKSRAY